MTLLASRYHLLRKLASGGMAEVWLGEQRGPGTFVRRMVVKTIHGHLAEDSDLVTAFADEARLAGLLSHPPIVRVEAFGEHVGRPFLVMAYVEGHTLKQLAALANGLDERMPERLILQIGIQVAGALNYAHGLCAENGEPLQVVHRDVSPQNVMITPEGTAKLLDQWEMTPETLIQMVSSPNGTTVAGRAILEASKAKEGIVGAIDGATKRSIELGKARG